MGRPAKPISLATGARTKEEKEGRQKAEEKLRGVGKPKPPTYLTKTQKKIFKDLVKRMAGAEGLLCDLDDWLIAKTAVAIEKLAQVDKDIENTPALLYDKDVMNTRAKYTQDFYRGCNELGLSPQARAKLAISLTENTIDPLLKALADDDE